MSADSLLLFSVCVPFDNLRAVCRGDGREWVNYIIEKWVLGWIDMRRLRERERERGRRKGRLLPPLGFLSSSSVLLSCSVCSLKLKGKSSSMRGGNLSERANYFSWVDRMSAPWSFPMSCKDLCFVFMLQESISIAVTYAHYAPSPSTLLCYKRLGWPVARSGRVAWEGVWGCSDLDVFLFYSHASTGSSKTLLRIDRRVLSVTERQHARLRMREICTQATVPRLLPFTRSSIITWVRGSSVCCMSYSVTTTTSLVSIPCPMNEGAHNLIMTIWVRALRLRTEK